MTRVANNCFLNMWLHAKHTDGEKDPTINKTNHYKRRWMDDAPLSVDDEALVKSWEYTLLQLREREKERKKKEGKRKNKK